LQAASYTATLKFRQRVCGCLTASSTVCRVSVCPLWAVRVFDSALRAGCEHAAYLLVQLLGL